MAPRRDRPKIPPGLVGGRRRRGNAALPDPPSPPPPPAVRRPGGSAAWASPAAQPPPSPPPTHVRALLPSSVPPPALLHRPLAKPSRPIGSTTGGGGVLPFRGPHLGFWPASVFCACAESALRELHSSLVSVRALANSGSVPASGTGSRIGGGSRLGSTCCT